MFFVSEGVYTNMSSVAMSDALGALLLLVSSSEFGSIASQRPYGVNMEMNAVRVRASRLYLCKHSIAIVSFCTCVTLARMLLLPVSLQLQLPCEKDERNLSS